MEHGLRGILLTFLDRWMAWFGRTRQVWINPYLISGMTRPLTKPVGAHCQVPRLLLSVKLANEVHYLYFFLPLYGEMSCYSGVSEPPESKMDSAIYQVSLPTAKIKNFLIFAQQHLTH